MTIGESIGGYRVLREFTTAGGGRCRWTFAERSGVEFFMKEFLSPKYPVPGAPGSPDTLAEKHRQCELFERRDRALMSEVNKKTAPGGNLVRTVDFFRQGTRYYKVTEKISTSGLHVSDIAKLPPNERTLILRTLCHSVGILHQLNIVHGDLKPDNILISRTTASKYTTKLIDFDDSYFVGDPPGREDIVGDQAYFSPELASYIRSDDSINVTQLTASSDIFTLGLIFSEYLTGTFPKYDARRYRYAWLAVLEGAPLTLRKRDTLPHIASLISKMLASRPEARPTIQDVFEELKRPGGAEPAPFVDPPRLRGTLVNKPPTPEPAEPSKLKGRLIEDKRRGP